MTGKRVASFLVLGVIAVSMAVMGYQGWLSHRPVRVGLVDGKLRPCPATPNCVSSDAPTGSHFVQPFPEPMERPMAVAREAISSTPRTRIITATDDYLHAEFESLIFRFVDDLEVHWRPEQGILAVRSQSRVGHWDLGTNRRRVERLRRQLAPDLPR